MTNILIGIVIFVFSVSFSTLAVLEIAGNGKNSQSD